VGRSLDASALDALRRPRTHQAWEKRITQGSYNDQGLVFADELGGMLDLNAVSRAFSIALAEASIKAKGYSLHSLRHSAGRRRSSAESTREPSLRCSVTATLRWCSRSMGTSSQALRSGQ
jgi:hypothetical protein